MQPIYDTREEVIQALKDKQIDYRSAVLLMFQLNKSKAIQEEIHREHRQKDL